MSKLISFKFGQLPEDDYQDYIAELMDILMPAVNPRDCSITTDNLPKGIEREFSMCALRMICAAGDTVDLEVFGDTIGDALRGSVNLAFYSINRNMHGLDPDVVEDYQDKIMYAMRSVIDYFIQLTLDNIASIDFHPDFSDLGYNDFHNYG